MIEKGTEFQQAKRRPEVDGQWAQWSLGSMVDRLDG